MSEKTRAPIFILGMQRSGTTLLRLMLNSHPHIAIPDETGFIVGLQPDAVFRTRFSSILEERQPLSNRQNASSILDVIENFPFPATQKGDLAINKDAVLSHSINTYSDLVDAVLSEYAKTHGKSRWGDKTPHYLADIDILWKLFPQSKIVHLVRDVRDVVQSFRTMSWGTRDILRIARRWSERNLVSYKVGSILPDQNYRLVRYEDLVLDPARELSSICGFLDETYSDEMLDYHRNAEDFLWNREMTWHKNSAAPPMQKKAFSWKDNMNRTDRIIVQGAARRAMEIFGYEVEEIRPTLRSRITGVYYRVLAR